MLDYRHVLDDLPLPGRELDSSPSLRLGSVSSYASSDSGLAFGAPLLSAGLKGAAAAADDDSDCDSDASGEYEPLRASTGALSARCATPPPLPPPRPRCNSLHAPRPPLSAASVTSAHFEGPPQASRSLGDLSGRSARSAPAAGRRNLVRLLGLSASSTPRRFGALWRRWTERAVRAGPSTAPPSSNLNKSLPNLSSGARPRAGAGAAPVRDALSVACTPRSASPGRSRVSPGALQRALKLVQEHTGLRRGRRPQRDVTPTLLAVSRLEVEEAPPRLPVVRTRSMAATDARRAETENHSAQSVKRRASFNADQLRGRDSTEKRTTKNSAVLLPHNSASSALPAIVVDLPDEGRRGTAEQELDCADRTEQDDDGYMTMNAMRAILRAPPPNGHLQVPDAGAATSDDETPAAGDESDYLDMAGIMRLRRAFSAQLECQTQPARPARAPRDERFVPARSAAGAKADYMNLGDLHQALLALHQTGRPAISEDE